MQKQKHKIHKTLMCASVFIRTRNRILDNQTQAHIYIHSCIRRTEMYKFDWKSGFHKTHTKIWKIDKEWFFRVECVLFCGETIRIVFIFEWNLSSKWRLATVCVWCLLILCIISNSIDIVTQMKWWMDVVFTPNYQQESEMYLRSKRMAILRTTFIQRV